LLSFLARRRPQIQQESAMIKYKVGLFYGVVMQRTCLVAGFDSTETHRGRALPSGYSGRGLDLQRVNPPEKIWGGTATKSVQ
jgi:hypothetical protein